MEAVVNVHVSKAGIGLEPTQYLTGFHLLAGAEVRLGGALPSFV